MIATNSVAVAVVVVVVVRVRSGRAVFEAAGGPEPASGGRKLEATRIRRGEVALEIDFSGINVYMYSCVSVLLSYSISV